MKGPNQNRQELLSYQGKNKTFSKTITQALKNRTTDVGAVMSFVPQNSYTEPDLIEAFCRGESEALKAVYLAHYPSVELYITKNSGSKEEAKDVFQETLLVVYQKATSIKFNFSCQLGTYIFAVAKRIWQKKLRDQRPLDLRTTGNVDELEQENIDQLILRVQRYKLYEEKFAELSPGCQELLKRFLQGDSTEAVRQHFGYGSTSYTKKRKCLCKGKLMKLIMDDPAYKDLTHND